MSLLVAAALGMGCNKPTATIRTVVVLPHNEIELQKFATERCLIRRGDMRYVPSRKYVNNICTDWPDGGKRDCCIIRDIDYWCGGSDTDQINTDKSLLNCMIQHASPYASHQPGYINRATLPV